MFKIVFYIWSIGPLMSHEEGQHLDWPKHWSNSPWRSIPSDWYVQCSTEHHASDWSVQCSTNTIPWTGLPNVPRNTMPQTGLPNVPKNTTPHTSMSNVPRNTMPLKTAAGLAHPMGYCIHLERGRNSLHHHSHGGITIRLTPIPMEVLLSGLPPKDESLFFRLQDT